MVSGADARLCAGGGMSSTWKLEVNELGPLLTPSRPERLALPTDRCLELPVWLRLEPRGMGEERDDRTACCTGRTQIKDFGLQLQVQASLGSGIPAAL